MTVQLDGVRLEGVRLRDVARTPRGGGGQGASDGPVFVDESGRRRRTLRRIGIAVGLGCAVYATVIVATLLSGNSAAPWLPVPGQDEAEPAGKVEASVVPSAAAGPVVADTGAPGPALSFPGGRTAPPDAGPQPSASGSAGTPSASVPTSPSAGASVKPFPIPSLSEPGTVSSPPVVASPVSPPPSGGGTPDPSTSPGDGTGTVADGPGRPAHAEPGSASGSPSPTASVL